MTWTDWSISATARNGSPSRTLTSTTTSVSPAPFYPKTTNDEQWKGSLIGHSDNNEDEDLGHLHVTYANNYWYNVFSRTPLIRFATVHIINNYWDSLIDTGVNCRMDAQVLIQSSAFHNCPDRAIFFADSDYTGYAVVDDVDLGGSSNSVPEGTLTPSSLPYAAITALGSGQVASVIPGTAGQKL
jgi:pectate lyase